MCERADRGTEEVTTTSTPTPVSPHAYARMVKGGAPPTMRADGPLSAGGLPISCLGIASLVLLRL